MLIHPARIAARLATATAIDNKTPWTNGRGPTLRNAAVTSRFAGILRDTDGWQPLQKIDRPATPPEN